MPTKKNSKSNQLSNPKEMERKINKITIKLWAGAFILLFIILAGGFFIFSGLNFKMIAQALSGNYNKTTGDTLTASEWNNLAVDFGGGGAAWDFGGIFMKCGIGQTCIALNPITSACNCPVGFTQSLFHEYTGTNLQYTSCPTTQVVEYFCWKDGVGGSGSIPISNNNVVQTLANGTAYQNTSSHKLIVVAFGNAVAGTVDIAGYIGNTNPPNTLVASDSGGADGIAQRKSITFVVPVGWFYKVTLDAGALTANAWEM